MAIGLSAGTQKAQRRTQKAQSVLAEVSRAMYRASSPFANALCLLCSCFVPLVYLPQRDVDGARYTVAHIDLQLIGSRRQPGCTPIEDILAVYVTEEVVRIGRRA